MIGSLVSSSARKDAVYVNRIHYPVTVLGPGKRIGIWFQGCDIHCPGCINKELQEWSEKAIVYSDQLWALLHNYSPGAVDGVTITGGEPFDQPGGLMLALSLVQSLGFDDVLVYSGYDFDHLNNAFAPILQQIDVLISGPFIESLPTNKLWRGSDNQDIHLLSPAARHKYPQSISQVEYQEEQRPIQFEISGDSLYLIGIPKRGDIEKLRFGCEKLGVLLS